ncbi:hypothetical protein FOCG_10320 [Fusarium oxysporum f. sp. radicis-lycopersici 26381]|uniref:Fungal N-terminal domain-containing protein n=4 Tax=Fusarium oxysporum TaxID=5507 RepID=A0A2H3GHW3_FUSOX|nr:hypothetical protein FOWG_15965 [Fusarium oxysporum f. sp. lycopersici MN25]EXL47797.1 hypothetical protein FOCG_10320 [Fusarium oxysporum f. sp. radicis-lycopersici 26381]KAJ4114884.1 hypothetical protein NW765_011515 [Fusarium oxysporum]PCD30331.1 hypothetical protein AU210_010013 [Fusarium oxysporum f. sp. radicis-cucumerinum]RKK15210.1 hypothetical protein BFJ65_g11750 [Fusarium oxysporum f. sp. cepae]RYC84454.1 hypothetical protein BFJ63_vAg12663 [Fusarium oxysporum f. sp. narcissi]
MEVISAASSIVSLLDLSLKVITTIREVNHAYHEAPQVVLNLGGNLEAIQEILELVREQPDLQVKIVGDEVARLKVTLEQLQEVHEKMQERAKKNKVKRYARAVLDHDRDSEGISDILRRIDLHQGFLTVRILVVNVGMAGNIRDGFQVACDTLTQVDQRVKAVLGEGLRIRRVLQDRSLLPAGESEEFIHLADDDRAAIENATARKNPTELQAEIERFVTKNLKAGDNLTYYEGDLGFDNPSTPGQRSVMEDICLGKDASVIRGNVSKEASAAFIAGLWGYKT